MSQDPNTLQAAATTFRRDEVEIACAMFAKASVGTDIGVLQRSAAGVRLHRKFLAMRGRLENPEAESRSA
jgi:hypothetical protein